MGPLIRASLSHYRGLHALVVAGVAVAVSVLAGALLVGSSVRASLRDLALERLGATELVVSSTTSFREALAADLRGHAGAGIAAAAPILAVTGAVTHEDSRRTAARVQVFGIDDRFLAFHGRGRARPTGASGLDERRPRSGAGRGSRRQRLAARRQADRHPAEQSAGPARGRQRAIRLTAARTIDRAALGEFSLLPSQGPALSLFVPLESPAAGSRSRRRGQCRRWFGWPLLTPTPRTM